MRFFTVLNENFQYLLGRLACLAEGTLQKKSNDEEIFIDNKKMIRFCIDKVFWNVFRLYVKK